MENTNPPMPPPPPNPNPNPYQQAPGGYQQAPGGYQQMPGGYQQPFGGMPVDLPGAGGVLTMGILGIIFSLGFIGIILNIIALVRAGNLTREYQNNPGRYTESSFGRVKAGKICAIIGLSLLGLGILIIAAANA